MYSTRKVKLVIWFLSGALLSTNAVAQQSTLSKEYQNRAEKMYSAIWKYYRAPAYPGLFTENFPSNQKTKLDYFQGEKVETKAVSFLWPFSGIFSATNVLLKVPGKHELYKPFLDSLVTGMEKYRDTTRVPTGYQAYPVEFEKADRYYDDNGLVGIEYLEAYFNTNNPVYLNRAKTVFKFIISGWDNQLGGGVYWLEGHHDQKPACSNGMAMLVALKLYKATNDTAYLNWGKRFYNWMKTNLSDPDNVYWNDKKVKDGSINKIYYSYNSGSMLEASVLLYQFTNDKVYLKNAEQIAKNTFDHFNKANHDPQLSMKIDLPWFMTVLFRGYEALYKIDNNYSYIEAISKNLDHAWQNSHDQYGFLTKSWTNKPAELNKPKWLLDEACIAELYARLSLLNK